LAAVEANARIIFEDAYRYFTVIVGEYKKLALHLAGNNADKALSTRFS
jgi:hypothetical protein